MGECIRATPEVIERTPEEAITCRTSSFKLFHGLGPADLCVLEKKRVGWTSDEALTSYHWVAGVEPLNAAAVCFYFNCLLKNQEKAGWLSSKYKFTKGSLCCWNPFSRIDCRVEMEIPGSVQEYAIQEDGNRIEMTDLLWKETFVASILRSMGRMPLEKPLKVLRPLLTIQGEAKAMKYCQELFEDGPKLGCSSGRPSVYNNLMLDVIKKFLLESSRFTDFIDFLTPMASKHSELISHIADAYMEKRSWQEAGKLLVDALLKDPHSPQLLASHARFLLKHQLPDHGYTLDWHKGYTASSSTEEFHLLRPVPFSSFPNLSLTPSPQNITSKRSLKELPRAKAPLSPPAGYRPIRLTAVLSTEEVSASNEFQRAKSTSSITGSAPAGGHELPKRELQQMRAALCLEEARQAMAKAPWDVRIHILAAEIMQEATRYPEAMQTLNSIPTASLLGGQISVPPGTRDLYILFGCNFPEGIPSQDDTKCTTPEQVEPRYLWEDDRSDEESSGLEEACDPALKGLQGHRLTGIALEIYQILVKINAALGWDGLLIMRSQVFHMEDEAPETGSNPKAMAARWFDSLIHILYDDLKQMNKWKVEDEEAMLQTPRRETSDQAQRNEAIFDVHDRSSQDWYYRGRLALRLLRMRSAVQAFRMSGFKEANVRAYLSLLEIYAHHGVLKESLLVVGHLLKLLYPKKDKTVEGTDHSSGCLTTDKDIITQPVHPIIRRSIFSLVAHFGLNQIRASCTTLCEETHYLLAEVLTDVVQLRVHGYDS